MENQTSKIIDITATPVIEDPLEKTLKLLETLNNAPSAKEGGEWTYIEGHGIVWEPTVGDRMGRPLVPPVEKTPPSILEEIVKWGGSFDFDNLPMNSVVIIKLNLDNPMRVQMMQRIIAKQVLEPRIETLKANRICVLFMNSDDDISVMSEEDMSQAGWERKDKSLIINPFK